MTIRYLRLPLLAGAISVMTAAQALAVNGREGWFATYPQAKVTYFTKAPASPAAKAKSPKPVPILAKVQFGYVLTPSAGDGTPVGSYARGCLDGAVQMPPTGRAWQIMRPSRNRNWGDPTLISYLTRLAIDMRDRENWRGILIGDLSQPRGGPMLTGHASHQNGLDADIWFTPMPGKVLSHPERETMPPLFLAEAKAKDVIERNWHEGWVRLLRRAASFPEVARIFVHPAIKKKLCEAPQYDRRWLTKVRAYQLHHDHLHVRLRCPPGNKSCVPQSDVSPDDGCGKELANWIKKVSYEPPPPKPAAAPPAPSAVVAKAAKAKLLAAKPAEIKPPPPPKGLVLTDLPPGCTTVLGEGRPPLLTAIAPDAASVLPPLPSPARASVALYH